MYFRLAVRSGEAASLGFYQIELGQRALWAMKPQAHSTVVSLSRTVKMRARAPSTTRNTHGFLLQYFFSYTTSIYPLKSKH